MPKYPIKQLVKEAIDTDPKCRGDRLYLVAWVWTRDQLKIDHPDFKKVLLSRFGFLIKHKNPYTIIREGDEYLSNRQDLKHKSESTEPIVRLLRDNQPSLPMSQINLNNAPEPPKPCANSEPAFDLGRSWIKKIKSGISE